MGRFIDGLVCERLGGLRLSRQECRGRHLAATDAPCARCSIGAKRLSAELVDEDLVPLRWPGGGRVLEVRFSEDVMTEDGRTWRSRAAYERELTGEAEPPHDPDLEARVARWLKETAHIAAEHIEPIPKRGRPKKKVRVEQPEDDEPDLESEGAADADEHIDELDQPTDAAPAAPSPPPNETITPEPLPPPPPIAPRKFMSATTHDPATKIRAVERLETESATTIADELGVSASTIHYWKKTLPQLTKAVQKAARKGGASEMPPKVAERLNEALSSEKPKGKRARAGETPPAASAKSEPANNAPRSAASTASAAAALDPLDVIERWGLSYLLGVAVESVHVLATGSAEASSVADRAIDALTRFRRSLDRKAA